MKVVVIEVVQGPTQSKTSDYSVKVKAMNPDGKMFDYEFIKNKLEDAKEIVQGFSWEMSSRRKWL
jgi:hypothetical protein